MLRRYAEIYTEKFMKLNHKTAEDWVKTHVHKDDRNALRPYIIKELTKQGFTGIVPGDN